jgi:hypothetical protein
MIPCRCGYTGTGPHRCHAGRPDPLTGEDGSRWCERDGVERFVAAPVALAGMQAKLGAMLGCYCEEHWRQVEAER